LSAEIRFPSQFHRAAPQTYIPGQAEFMKKAAVLAPTSSTRGNACTGDWSLSIAA